MHKSIYENKRLRLGAGIITAAMVSLALSAGLPVAKSRAAVVGYEKKMETDAEGFKISEGFQLVEDDKASKNWQHGTYAAGESISYRFFGTGVAVYGFSGEEGGDFQISLDGEKKGEYSASDEEETYQKQIARLSGLKESWHEVEIRTLSEGKWHAVDFLKINIGKENYTATYNLAQVGNVITSVPAPTGGGNKDLNVVKNEKIYPVGTSGVGPAQYDSYVAGTGENYFWMGYDFDDILTFSKLVFQEGDHWADGGWFQNASSLKIQVRNGGEWTNVPLLNDPGYPASISNKAEAGESSEIFEFIFAPVEGDGIRIYGKAGGSGHFVSVSQIEVYALAEAETLAGGADYRDALIYVYTGEPYTVTFESNGGTAVPPEKVADGNKLERPASPAKEGYVFEGWYTDEALTLAYDFQSPVTADMTLYAKWEEKVPDSSSETSENASGSGTSSGCNSGCKSAALPIAAFAVFAAALTFLKGRRR